MNKLMRSSCSALAVSFGLTGLAAMAEAAPADEIANGEVVDLTVTVSDNHPAHWPFHPPFKRWTMNWFEAKPGPYGKNPVAAPNGPDDSVNGNVFQSVFPYFSQQYVIDDHTGTQIDYPAHFVPPEDSGLEFANEASWTEFLRNVGKLPARGAYFIAISAKIIDMSGGLSRALAIKPRRSRRTLTPRCDRAGRRLAPLRSSCEGAGQRRDRFRMRQHQAIASGAGVAFDPTADRVRIH